MIHSSSNGLLVKASTQALCLLSLMLGGGAFAQTPLHEGALSSENFRVTARTQDSGPLINHIHRWIIHMEDPSGQAVEGAQLQIRGGMPEHNHGLPTSPKMTRYLGQGDYLIEGMKFHMAGHWQIEIVVSANNQQDLVTLDLYL